MKLAKDLLTRKITPLGEKDTRLSALAAMQSLGVKQLPYVIKGEFRGMISRKVLEAKTDLALDNYTQPPISVLLGAHPFAILDHLSSCLCESVAVVDDMNQYVGIIFYHTVIDEVNTIINSMSEGVLVEMIVKPRHYSLSEIARIAEQEDITIESFNTYFRDQENLIYLLVRINREDPTAFIRNLERYGYEVSNFAQKQSVSNESVQKRIEELLLYLDI